MLWKLVHVWSGDDTSTTDPEAATSSRKWDIQRTPIGGRILSLRLAWYWRRLRGPQRHCVS